MYIIIGLSILCVALFIVWYFIEKNSQVNYPKLSESDSFQKKIITEQTVQTPQKEIVQPTPQKIEEAPVQAFIKETGARPTTNIQVKHTHNHSGKSNKKKNKHRRQFHPGFNNNNNIVEDIIDPLAIEDMAFAAANLIDTYSSPEPAYEAPAAPAYNHYEESRSHRVEREESYSAPSHSYQEESRSSYSGGYGGGGGSDSSWSSSDSGSSSSYDSGGSSDCGGGGGD